MMSLRLRMASAFARWVVKPQIARAEDPVELREAFEDHARRSHLTPPLTAHRNGQLDGVPVEWVSCGRPTGPETIFYIHGGGFVAGSPATHRNIVAHLCAEVACEAVVPDYRLAPEHPFPAGLDDLCQAYGALVESGRRPQDIVLVGDSAGGNLVMALLWWLNDQGLPMPRAAVAISPVLDMSGTSASLTDNAQSEAVLPANRFDELKEMYLGAHPADDPRVSPIQGVFPSLPPLLFHVSDGEILRDDTLSMQNRLIAQGHEPLVRSWPGGFHVFHILRGWVPDAAEALNDIADFIKAQRSSDDS